MVAKISVGKSLYGALAYNGEKINEAKGRPHNSVPEMPDLHRQPPQYYYYDQSRIHLH